MKNDTFLRHLEFKFLTQLYLHNPDKRKNGVIENIIAYLFTYHERKVKALASVIIDEDADDAIGRIANRRTYSASPEDLEDFVTRNGREGEYNRRRVFKLFLEDREKWGVLSPKIEKSLVYKRLQKVKEIFGLSDLECQIISLYFIDHTSYIFKELSHTVINDELSMMGEPLAKVLEVSAPSINRALSSSANLIRNGIFEIIGRHGSLRLCDTLVYYLLGQSETLFSDEFFIKQETKHSFALDSFPLNPIDHQVVLSLLQGGTRGGHILLHGIPGTGKTEYCRALAKELGLELFVAKSGDSDGDESIVARKRSICYAQKSFKNRPVLIVIDEADSILETNRSSFFGFFRQETDRKSWLNGILDDLSVPMIWVTNSIDQIDDSTRRRFSYMVKFKHFDSMQRLEMWKRYQQTHEVLFNDQELLDLSKEFRINAGSISTAFRHVASLGKSVPKEEKRKMLKAMASNHQQMVGETAHGEGELTSFYDPSIINVSTPVENVITSVKKFYQYIDQGDRRSLMVRNMNILLQGPTGTGKTEFVKYLAKQTGKKVIQLNFSDMVSCYVGMTEKAISSAFRNAEEEGAILFFDEADSLFTSRLGAHQSWEVSRTNELLVQMEKFSGVLICSTNFMDQLDSASIRRFNIKVSFDHLTNQAKVMLFDKMLRSISSEDLSEDQRTDLCAIKKLTVGDFKVVMQRNFFLEKVTPKKLIEELRNETIYRGANKKGIGF